MQKPGFEFDKPRTQLSSHAEPAGQPPDYAALLDRAIESLHQEGRYRTFIDIERHCGRFRRLRGRGPMAVCVRLRCGAAMTISEWDSIPWSWPRCATPWREAVPVRGGRATSRGQPSTTSASRRSSPDLHGKEAALLFTSAYIANDATLSTLSRLIPG